MKNTFMLIFENRKTKETVDIEVPKNITANELVMALNKGFRLGLDINNPAKCFLRAKNPIALIRGDMLLEEYHLHDGSIIWYGEEKT